jgi:RHS repeat-associated protein
LGNIREVVDETGKVLQTNNYYPFGMPYTDSPEDNSSYQKYKYNGKELDLVHGLNTCDYGARQYNPVIPSWDRVDMLAEKYYEMSPYNYCGGSPVNRIDYWGLDYWSTNDPDEIARYMSNIRDGISPDMSNWYHTSDADFSASLFYNDQTDMYYYSYGTAEKGEFVCNARFFSGGLSKVEDAFSESVDVLDNIGTSLKKNGGNSSFGSNGKFYWHAAGETGFYGNQYVSTVKLTQVGRAITKVTGPVGKVFDGIQIYNGYKQDGNQIGYHTVRATADFAGGWAGAAAGLELGTSIGCLFGGVGAIPGAIIGGAVGGIIGAYGGGRLATSSVDMIYGK